MKSAAAIIKARDSTADSFKTLLAVRRAGHTKKEAIIELTELRKSQQMPGIIEIIEQKHVSLTLALSIGPACRSRRSPGAVGASEMIVIYAALPPVMSHFHLSRSYKT
jgi:hypothetical protein